MTLVPRSTACSAETAREAVGWMAFGELDVAAHPAAVARMLTMWQRWSSRFSSAAAMTFVVQDLSPMLEALVRGDDGRGMLG